MSSSEPDVAGSSPVDFDLHGLVGVRLFGAGPREVAAVARQLGPIRAELAREPDLVIRFVDRIPVVGPVRTLGLEEAGFTDDAFLVLRGKHKARTRVRIPMDRVGGPCEILCERGLPAVPLLIPIVNLTALAKGVVPLHAAAFAWREACVVVTGWSKGGKTETLLAFAARGARYIADEWCYLAPGGRVFGIPEPIRLWRWHLAQLPRFRSLLPAATRARLAGLAALAGLPRALPRGLRGSGPGRAAERLGALLAKQLHADVPPEVLFGPGAGSGEGAFTHLLFAVSGESPETVVKPVDPGEVAARMVHSLAYERAPFQSWYQMFRFAFPDLQNPHVEQASERERALLRQALAARPAYVVTHPYPVDIPRLFEAVAPYLG